jgi:hypothetical protein
VRWGITTAGADPLELTADRLYLFDVGGTLLEDLVVGSVVAYLDGLGAGAGEQVVRPVVMEAARPTTIAYGDPVVVTDGQAGGWVHMPFDLPPTLRAGVEARAGIQAGPASTLARLFVTLSSPGVSSRYVSPYAAPPDASGTATDVNALASALVVGVTPWAPPSGLAEEDLAELPVRVAQGTFDGAALSTVEGAACGWHYSNDAPPAPTSAIVRTGGPLQDLVGQRIRVTATTPIGPASVVVYVIDELPFDDVEYEDISLARDAFMLIGGLWARVLTVRVEVVA